MEFFVYMVGTMFATGILCLWWLIKGEDDV